MQDATWSRNLCITHTNLDLLRIGPLGKNLKIWNKMQTTFSRKYAFGNVVYKMSAILQWGKLTLACSPMRVHFELGE